MAIDKEDLDKMKKDIKANHNRALNGFVVLSQEIDKMKFLIEREEKNVKGLKPVEAAIVVSLERVAIEEIIRGFKKRKQLVEETILPEFEEVSKQYEIYMEHWNEIEPALDRHGGTEEDIRNFQPLSEKFMPVALSCAAALKKLSATTEQGMKEMGEILNVSIKRFFDEFTKRTERNFRRLFIISSAVAIFGAMWYIFTEAGVKTKLFRTISTFNSLGIGVFASFVVAWLFHLLNWEQRRISKELLRQQYEGDLFKSITRLQELKDEVFPQNRSKWWRMTMGIWRELRLAMRSKEMVRVKKIFEDEGL